MFFMDYAYLRHNNRGPNGPYGQMCVQFMIFLEEKSNSKKTVNYKRAINLIRSWVSESKSSIDLFNNVKI